MLLLEERQTQQSDLNKFCHVVCKCSPTMALCGAYKPILCRVEGISIKRNRCPVCQKIICADCKDLLTVACIRCGE